VPWLLVLARNDATALARNPVACRPRERGHFNIRGFLMGFALSAMIGAAFYIYFTAG
jgi:hypothetical protein